MGDIIQFRPRERDAIQIHHVRLIDHLDSDPATGIQYAMDDDNAPPIVPACPFVAPDHDGA